MNWKFFRQTAVDTAVNLASDKATKTAVGFLVNKLGPHRVIQKFGYISGGIGILLLLIALTFGKLQLLLIPLGVLGILLGLGLYFLNEWAIGLATWLVKRVSTGVWRRVFSNSKTASPPEPEQKKPTG